jgi:hypothetical protein
MDGEAVACYGRVLQQNSKEGAARPTSDAHTKGNAMSTSASAPLTVHIQRIYSEYLEMPGLRLTCAQAQRLWGLEAAICMRALEFLVVAKFLRHTDAGQYARVSDGPVASPLRMARAELGRQTPLKALTRI